jgi:hypothetical protein
MNFSNQIKILPWVGKNYKNTFPKLLILGMSTYYPAETVEEKRSCVNIMVNKYCFDDWRDTFWTKIMNLFKEEQESIIEFWNRVCLYEYIQELMNEPKQETPKEYWENAKKPFDEILNKLQPDIIVAIGYKVYDNLPEGKIGETIKHNGTKMNTKIINDKIYVCRIIHVNAGGGQYNKETWNKLYKNFLKYYFNKYVH